MKTNNNNPSPLPRDPYPTLWWLHGSAPGGEAFFNAALDVWTYAPRSISVTCNAGLIEFLCHPRRNLRPDYYWLQDGKAIELYGRYAQTAHGLGSMILTHRPVHLRELLGLPALRVDLVEPAAGELQYLPGVYQHVTLSGLLCLQWIAYQLRPGDTVLMTGMTGYASTPDEVVRDTFDGRMGKPHHLNHTTKRIAPFTQSVCASFPGVGFIFCGKPHRVFGPDAKALPSNVTVCCSPADLEAHLNQLQTPIESKGNMSDGTQENQRRRIGRDQDQPTPARPATPCGGRHAAHHRQTDQTAESVGEGLPDYQSQSMNPRDIVKR